MCDIEAEKLEDFKIKAEKHELSVEVLNKLPNLYINPFAEKYKTFNNVESSKHNFNQKVEKDVNVDNSRNAKKEITIEKNRGVAEEKQEINFVPNKMNFKKI